VINLDTCIICGSSENLNTSMTISVDDKEITVKICDADSDTATPKLVKDHYADKKSEIDEIIAKAKELGLEVNIPTDGGIVTVEKPPEPKQTPAVDPTIAPTQTDPAIMSAIEGTKDDGVLSTRVIDNVSQNIRSISGGEAGAESHAAYIPGSGQDKLDPVLLEGKVKMAAGEGRGGQVIAVPSIRVDQTGTTTIRVKQNVDDNVLQRRFKELAGSVGADRPRWFDTKVLAISAWGAAREKCCSRRS